MNTLPLRKSLPLIMVVAASASLQCSGPNPVREHGSKSHQWIKLGPGGGGSTFVPVFSPADPSHFIVRCDMTGTYRTTDGGNSYHQMNFPNGSSSYTYDPTDTNVIYVGSTILQRSRDGGVTWEQLFPKTEDVTGTLYSGDHATFRVITNEQSLYPADFPRISHVVVDPGDNRKLYFSMGPYFFYSADAGKNWARQEMGSSVIHIYTNDTNAKNDVFIFSAGELKKFDKNNKTVSALALPPGMLPAFSFSAGTVTGGDEMIFYALHNEEDANPEDEFGETQLWISRDSGGTWNRVTDATLSNPGFPPSYSMIACAERDANNAYIVCNRYLEKKADGDTIYWYGAMKTSDGGATFEWVWKGGGGSGQYGVKDGIGVSNLSDAWTERAFGGEYIRLLDAGVYPNDGNIAVVTDWYRTMKTSDGGHTWREVYSMQQADGSYTSRGMDVTTNYGVHFDPFDPNHIAVSYTDIGYHHSYNNGKSWFRSVEGVPSEWVNTCYWVVFDPEIKGKMWSAWSSLHDFPRGKMTRSPTWKRRGKGGICISTDGGKSWTPSFDGMGFDSPATSVVLDPKSPPGQRTLYASVYSKGVFKSTDDGKTWILKNNGIEANTAAFELTLSPNGDLFVIVSPTPVHKDGNAGIEFYPGAVYRSKDGAENWTRLQVSDGLLFPNGMGIDPKNADRVYLACWADITLSDLVGSGVVRSAGVENKTLETPGGIFMSEDGGDTWKPVFDNKQYVYDVTVDPRHPGRVYCNTFNGSAWRSDDYGKSWNKLKGYDFHWGHRVIADENDDEKVYITTYGSSLLHGEPRR